MKYLAALFLKIWINLKTRMFCRLFHSNKMHLLTLLGFLQTKMTDFPPFLYTSTGATPTLSYIWSLKNVPLLGGATPYNFTEIKQQPLPGQNSSSLQDEQSRKKNPFSTSIIFIMIYQRTILKWKNPSPSSVLVYSFSQQILIVICRTHFTVLLRFSQNLYVNSEVQKPTDDCIFRCRQSS